LAWGRKSSLLIKPRKKLGDFEIFVLFRLNCDWGTLDQGLNARLQSTSSITRFVSPPSPAPAELLSMERTRYYGRHVALACKVVLNRSRGERDRSSTTVTRQKNLRWRWLQHPHFYWRLARLDKDIFDFFLAKLHLHLLCFLSITVVRPGRIPHVTGHLRQHRRLNCSIKCSNQRVSMSTLLAPGIGPLRPNKALTWRPTEYNAFGPRDPRAR
jgi:hypothetical protein